MRNPNAKKSDFIIRAAYGPKARIKLTCTTQGRTKQSFKDDSDINVIMARYFKTGLIDYVKKTEPHYGDVRGHDFQAAQNIVATARSMFHGLPANLREHFENDPGKFFNFVNNPRNEAECIELGLKHAKQPDLVVDQAGDPKAPKAPAEAPKGPKKAAEPPAPNSKD